MFAVLEVELLMTKPNLLNFKLLPQTSCALDGLQRLQWRAHLVKERKGAALFYRSSRLPVQTILWKKTGLSTNDPMSAALEIELLMTKPNLSILNVLPSGFTSVPRWSLSYVQMASKLSRKLALFRYSKLSISLYISLPASFRMLSINQPWREFLQRFIFEHVHS